MAARCVNGHDTPRGQACMYCGASLVAPAPPAPPAGFAGPPPAGYGGAPPAGYGGPPPTPYGGWSRPPQRGSRNGGLIIVGIVLVSLVAVFVVFIALLTIGVFTTSGVVQKTKRGDANECRIQYKTIVAASEAVRAQTNTFPKSLEELYQSGFLKRDLEYEVHFKVSGDGSAMPTITPKSGECVGVDFDD